MDLGDFEPGSDERPTSDSDAGEDAPPTDAGEPASSGEASESPGDPGASTDPTSDGGEATGPDVDFESYDASPAGEDRGLGAIAVSQGLRVAEDGDETTLRAYVTTDNRDTVRLGKYLLVPYPDDELLFGKITALEYAQEFQTDDATEIHARRAMRRDEFEERDYKFVAELDPLAVLFEDGDASGADEDAALKRRMVDRVPKPGAIVTEATDPDQIKTGLKIPGDGIFLGHLSVGGEKVRTAAQPPTIDYRLRDDYADGDPLLFRHTLVAGGTGSGKTHATKNVLRQLLADDRTYEMDDGRDARLAVVQFDPQDEYAQMHDDNPAMDPATARRYEREGIVHGGHDDTLALVPKEDGISYGGGNHRAEQLAFTIPFSMAQDRPWLVAGSSLNENQYPALMHLLNRFFREYGNGGTYDE